MPKLPVVATTDLAAPKKAVVTPLNDQTATFTIRGKGGPFVSNNFSQEAMLMWAATMEKPKKAGDPKPPKKPRDFKAEYLGSMHIAENGGWQGINAAAFRAGMIRACKPAGIEMIQAKSGIFIEPDGFEKDTQVPLVKITKGKPAMFITYTRNGASSVDLRARARWAEGWEAKVRITYDADQYDFKTILNLLERMGRTIGVGAGRPGSKDSAGQGWGTFTVV